MSLQIGDTAPDFEAETTEGPIGFHDWIVSLVRRRAKLRLRSVSHSFLGLRLDFQLIDLIAQFANIRIIWPVANLHIL